MKPKKIVTVVLLLFVAASVVFLLVRKTGSTQPESQKSPQQVQAAKDAPTRHQYIVYYFHGNKRCYTCNQMEKLTREAVDGGFAQQLKQGEVLLQVINTDEQEHNHFVDDFKLATKAVVVVEVENGITLRFKKLEHIWDLVDDPSAFITYIQDNVTAFMDGRS